MIRSRCFAAGLAVLFASVSGEANATDRDLTSRVDAYVRPYVARGQFSGVVLIARGNRVLVRRTYGFADFQRRTPTRLRTKYRLASLSKTFTAAAIVRLAQEHKLSFDDRLARYLPSFPNADRITVDQLLRHTSGIGEFEEPGIYRTGGDLGTLVGAAAKAKPLFEPGKGDAYSNEGYVLLARIVEMASGIGFADYLERTFFRPLGMTATGVEGRFALAGRAQGTRASFDGAPSPIAEDEAPLYGASGLYGDAEDLLTWMRTLRGGRVVDYGPLDYPYGWGRRVYGGRRLLEQSGMVEGFSTYMASYDDGTSVVALSNVQSGMQGRLGPDLAAVLGGAKPSTPPRIAADARSASPNDLAGDYRNPEIGYPFRLAFDKGELISTWGPFPFWRPVSVVAPDCLAIAADYTFLTVQRNASGRVVGLTMQPIAGNGPSAEPGTSFTKERGTTTER